jgi:hypothetical protein
MVASTGEIYKYNSDGEKIWSIPRDERYTTSMALDWNANIYLARTGTVAKYNSNGVKQWEVSDTLAPNGGIILVYNDENVYVRGSKGISKFNAEGILQWIITSSYSYTGYHMTLDNTGNPIICGLFFNEQYDIIKFDANGVKLWQAFYIDPFPIQSYPPAPRGPMTICTDRFNNIYIAGSSNNEKGIWNITIIKCSPTGEEKWTIRHNDQEQVNRLAIAVKVDTLGNIYVTGFNLVYDYEPFEVITLKYRQPNFLAVKAEEINEYSFNLYQNYPNPFNPKTTIHFSIPKRSFVTLRVYDLLGREIALLVNEERSAGEYKTVFDGKNLSSGVYFYRLLAGEFSQTKKFILQK